MILVVNSSYLFVFVFGLVALFCKVYLKSLLILTPKILLLCYQKWLFKYFVYFFFFYLLCPFTSFVYIRFDLQYLLPSWLFVYVPLKISLQVFSHNNSKSNFMWRLGESSANFSSISALDITNRSGPRTEPCGTVEFTPDTRKIFTI